MGKFSTGDKPKFDLIAASKTKKYKIITSIVLVIGILCVAISLLLRSMLTPAILPKSLEIHSLSGLTDAGTCVISQDQIFNLSTGTPQDRALSQPIQFILDAGASSFLEVYDKTNSYPINSANYQGMFYLHIKNNAPEYVKDQNNQDVRPSGKLTIKCGAKILQITFTYHKI